MKNLEQSFDIIVVGAGHAGCEAALASARLGLQTVMFTVSVDSIALMPCNPNVGGSSKGHLVRELDALGGEMGKNIDKTFIQSKMLNQSKGPAVHSLRAQADKQAYSTEMRKTLENTENLTIRQGEVTELLVEDNHITGVKTFSGATYHAKAVVLCTGTYLKARCIYGDVRTKRPSGSQLSHGFSEKTGNRNVPLQNRNPCQDRRKHHRLFQNGRAVRRQKSRTVLLLHRPGIRTDRAEILLADLHKRKNTRDHPRKPGQIPSLFRNDRRNRTTLLSVH